MDRRPPATTGSTTVVPLRPTSSPNIAATLQGSHLNVDAPARSPAHRAARAIRHHQTLQPQHPGRDVDAPAAAGVHAPAAPVVRSGVVPIHCIGRTAGGLASTTQPSIAAARVTCGPADRRVARRPPREVALPAHVNLAVRRNPQRARDLHLQLVHHRRRRGRTRQHPDVGHSQFRGNDAIGGERSPVHRHRHRRRVGPHHGQVAFAAHRPARSDVNAPFTVKEPSPAICNAVTALNCQSPLIVNTAPLVMISAF